MPTQNSIITWEQTLRIDFIVFIIMLFYLGSAKRGDNLLTTNLNLIPESLPHHVQLNASLGAILLPLIVISIATILTMSSTTTEKNDQRHLLRMILYAIILFAMMHFLIWFIIQPGGIGLMDGDEPLETYLRAILHYNPLIIIGTFLILFITRLTKKYPFLKKELPMFFSVYISVYLVVHLALIGIFRM